MTPGEMRAAVLTRDHYICRARVIDPESGICRDEWGNVDAPYRLEADYVRLGAKGKRHELPEDHITLCPGHHRGTGNQAGYCWATSHRPEMRAWLDQRICPDCEGEGWYAGVEQDRMTGEPYQVQVQCYHGPVTA